MALADDVVANAGTGGETFRVYSDGVRGWMAGVLAFVTGGSAGAWTLTEVQDVAGKRVPVKIGDPIRGTLTDRSIVSPTAASQQLVAANTSRNYLTIQNAGNVNIGVNITGGTAAIGGTGTITLFPGGSQTFAGPGFVPTNAITVIGTAGQPIIAAEG